MSAANYSFSLVNGTLTVGRATLTVTANNVTRAYGGPNALTVSYSGFLGGDNTNVLSGAPDLSTSADVHSTVSGSPYTIVVTNGTLSAASYDFAFVNGQLTITQAVLTVSATGIDKVYDATTDATVTLTDNRVAGDNLTTSYGAATFANKAIGTAKPVSVSGISVTGPASVNYTFNTTATTTANITPATLSASITAFGKVYDGTSTAAIATRNLSGVAGSDDVSLTGGTATFADRNVGTNKNVTATGLALSGLDAGNYTVNTTATTTANITRALLKCGGAVGRADFEHDGGHQQRPRRICDLSHCRFVERGQLQL